MNCSIFTENLEAYIARDIPEDLALMMDEHILECETCRELYKEEILLENAITEALSLEDVILESQKDKIMNRIDKNKYKITTNNIEKVNKMRYFKITAPIAAAILFIILINPTKIFENFESKSNSLKQENSISSQDIKDAVNPSNNIVMKDKEETNSKKTADLKEGSNLEEKETSIEKSNNISKKDIIKDNTKNQLNNRQETSSKIENDKAIDTSKENDNEPINNFVDDNKNLEMQVKFHKNYVNDKEIVKSLGGGIKSPNDKFIASIKKSDIYLEKIYIKDLIKNETWSLETNINDKKSLPNYIEWWDDEKLFVVIRDKKDDYLTEKLYMLNVNNGIAYKVYTLSDSNRGIIDINKIDDNDIELKVRINPNDNQDKDYMESYIIHNIKSSLINNNK
ncbi:DUF4652 domain-containing protein [Clostridium sp. JNZ J1-5]